MRMIQIIKQKIKAKKIMNPIRNLFPYSFYFLGAQTEIVKIDGERKMKFTSSAAMLDQFKRETKRREVLILILILIRELRQSHKALKMRGSVSVFISIRFVQ